MYAKYLLGLGYSVKIFAASTIHNTNINLINDKIPFIERSYDGIDFVHIRCSNYLGNGVKRVVNMKQFAHRFESIAEKFSPPDVIVADMSCIQYYCVYRYCRKHGIKLIIETRDLWPFCIEEYLGYSHYNPIIQYLYHKEKLMYERADALVFAMEGGIQYIIDKKWDIGNGGKIDTNKAFYINNGINLAGFDKQSKQFVYEDSDLDRKIFKVIYTGSIRLAYNIQGIIDASLELKKIGYRNKIAIYIYGNGDDLEPFKDQVKKEGLDEIIYFKGFVDKKYIPNILSRCSVCLLSMKSARTFLYGPSQNKLFEYLASGKPVILTTKVSYDIVSKSGSGIVVDKNDGKNIADAIIEIYNLSKDKYEQMCKNARNCSKSFDYSVLSRKLEEIINHLIELKN